MPVTYQLTQQDVVEGLIAHRNRSALTKWGLRLGFLVILFLIAGGTLVLALRPDRNTFFNLLPLFVFGIIWIIAVSIAPRFSARKQFSNYPSVQESKTMSWDASGIQWKWDSGSAHLDWKNFVRVHETSRQMLLYNSPLVFNLVPKRAFKPEEFAEFRALIERNLPSKS